MRHALTTILLLLGATCTAQYQRSGNKVYNLTLAYQPATVQILKDSLLLSPLQVNNEGKITYVDLQPGFYSVKVTGRGQPETIKDSLYVTQGQKLVLNIKIAGPCLYHHAANYIPACPQNHTDSIIPIVYGLIAGRGDTFIKNKKDEKVRYAGCVVTGCDPQYYCKLHDLEF
jgi:hypothetical protein